MSDENKFKHRTVYTMSVPVGERGALIDLVEQRIREAENKLREDVEAALYRGAKEYPPLTPEERRRRRLEEWKWRLVRPWFWVKQRIIGTWNVWRHGECGGCEQEI